MAVQTAQARTSAAELQTYMEHPSEAFIRKYALEVFGEPVRTGMWLTSEIPALGNATPDRLLSSNDDGSLRRVPGTLIQIDYGVAG